MSMKKTLILLFAMTLFTGCATMFGIKDISQFDQSKCDDFVAAVQEDDLSIHAVTSDAEHFETYRSLVGDSLWRESISAQPVQILYFKDGSLVSYHINCTAKARFFNLDWNTDHRFETFPPTSAIELEERYQALSQLRKLYDISDNRPYLIVVFWSNMTPKIAKTAVETVKKNLRQYGNPNIADIVLINTDHYYLKYR